jgi:N-methylhydantoinase A
MKNVISTDQGGTFVDSVIIDENGALFTGKAPTTPDNPSTGILNAVTVAAEAAGLSLEKALANCRMFFNGTTVTTNAMIERKGSVAGLIVTRGFEDTLVIGRVKSRWVGLDEHELLNYKSVERPAPVVPLTLTRGVSERIDAHGEVIVPLDTVEAERLIDDLVQSGANALAISLLWSFKNPAHEKAIAEIARKKYPDLYVVASTDLVPVMGEYERTNTAAIEAFLGPTLSRYVSDLRAAIHKVGYSNDVLVMQSIGGLSPASTLTHAAVTSLRSGPVGGIIASAQLGREMGEPNLITADMGGTTLDVGLIVNGEPQNSQVSIMARQLVMVPAIEVESIGAGGGSIAWIDSAHALHVGPRSQGSLPGPACYGRGGTLPTVTDANLILGYIAPDSFPGNMRLNVEYAREAIKKGVADPLGMTVEQSAQAIWEIVNSRMADLVRRATVRRGFDPREFVMMAFGGGGPLHAGGFGPETQVRRIIIPSAATVFSALGIAQSDIRHFFASTFIAAISPLAKISDDWISRLDHAFNELVSRADTQFDAEGIDPVDRAYTRSLDLRYKSQIHELSIPLRIPGRCSRDSLIAALDDFAARYERMYGRGSTPSEAPVELVTIRVDATAATRSRIQTKLRAQNDESSHVPPKGSRQVWWQGKGSILTPIYQLESLPVGWTIKGPAVIETYGTSMPVAPAQRAELDRLGNINILFDQ